MNKILAISLLLSLCVSTAIADVQPNGLFNNHAVLQRGIKIPVWGTASEGEKVTVSMQGQTVSTVAKNGKWEVALEPIPAGGPYTMTIQGNNTITLNDIMIGEVWLASGQSNMERQLGPRRGQQLLTNWLEEKKNAANNNISFCSGLFFCPRPASPIECAHRHHPFFLGRNTCRKMDQQRGHDGQ